MIVIENCNSLSDLRQKLIDGEKVRTARDKPCEDAIRREDAINAVSEALEHVFVENEDVARKMMNKLPSVNSQPKTGHWVMPVQDDGMSEPIYYQVRCSECGFDLDPQTWHMELHQYGADNYCPNCGAKMQEVIEE